MTDSAGQQHLALAQLRNEYQMLQTSLRTQLASNESFLNQLEKTESLLTQREKTSVEQNIAALSAQINQMNVEFETVRRRIKDVAIGQVWISPNRPRQLLGDLPGDLRSVSNRGGFGIRRSTIAAAVALPHWCLVAFSASLALVLGIRRAWRFTLRTLLIVTTLVAVALALVVVR
jgi:hypothetical protein